MPRFKALLIATALGGVVIGGGMAIRPGLVTAFAAERVVLAPVPRFDPPASSRTETAIFAGGCYWGVEGVFSHVKGVRSAQSGYAGGPAGRRVTYEQVGEGDTGFAEAVRVVYDPQQVSYGSLLRIFVSVVADPTTLNYQGPDHGTQYRSALFPQTPAQSKIASAYLDQLRTARIWDAAIVTRIEASANFQPAEAEHQDFLERNQRNPYIVRWDMPKLTALKRLFPQNYVVRSSR